MEQFRNKKTGNNIEARKLPKFFWRIYRFSKNNNKYAVYPYISNKNFKDQYEELSNEK